jgi:hypothetical protein
VWLDNHTVENPDAFVAKSDLAGEYNKDARKQGQAVMTAPQFGREFKRARPHIEDGQRTVNGKPRVWCYIGIGIKHDGGGGGGGQDPEDQPSPEPSAARESRNESNASNGTSLFVEDIASEQESEREVLKNNNRDKPVTLVTPVTSEAAGVADAPLSSHTGERLTTEEVPEWRRLKEQGMDGDVARREIIAARKKREESEG